MKLRGRSYFIIALMAVMIVIIMASLMMEHTEAKLMPLLFAGVGMLLSAIALRTEIQARPKPKGKENENRLMEQEGWRGYLVNGAWLGGFILGIYLLGFIIAIPIFVLSYMMWLGTKRVMAFISAILATAFVYGVFQRLLGIDLHPGLLLPWLGF